MRVVQYLVVQCNQDRNPFNHNFKFFVLTLPSWRRPYLPGIPDGARTYLAFLSGPYLPSLPVRPVLTLTSCQARTYHVFLTAPLLTLPSWRHPCSWRTRQWFPPLHPCRGMRQHSRPPRLHWQQSSGTCGHRQRSAKTHNLMYYLIYIRWLMKNT